jgi:hypothetical protein
LSISKTSKVWLSGLGGGALAVVGGCLLVTGVGAGAGAVMITSGLATIGGVVGGGMSAGIGVLGAGSALVASATAAIANKVIEDPDLVELKQKLSQANTLYNAAKSKNIYLEQELRELNNSITQILHDQKKNKDEIELLKARLIVLINKLGNKEKDDE